MSIKNALFLVKRSAPVFLMLVIAGATVGLAKSASAETTVQPLADPLNQESRGDIFSNRGNGQPNSMLDIIHRAMQGQGPSAEEFSEQQSENLDDAAAQFRKMQQERLQNSGTSTSPAPSNNSNP